MSRLALSLLVVFFFAVVYCEEEVQLGSFEGTYVLPDGTKAYFCQDGNKVQGTYREIGIIRGGANGDIVTGSFYQAGLGPCVLGTASLSLTDYGMVGTFGCNGQSTPRIFQGTRTSSFRPTDEQCGLGSENTVDTVEGHWVNGHYNLDLCFVNFASSNYTVHGSLQRQNSAGEVVDWYITGYWVDNGKIVLGTWYEDFSAGAILLFLRNDGSLDYYWWTGLIYDQGETVIDINQLYNPEKHGVGSYARQLTFQIPPDFSTTGDQCEANAGVKDFVLRNLPRDEDEDYYYFVDVEYLDVIYYLKPVELETGSDASSIVVSSFVLLICVIFAMF